MAEPIIKFSDSLHEIQTSPSQFVASGKSPIPFHVIPSTTHLPSMVLLVVYLTAKHWTFLIILKQELGKQSLI